MRLRWSAVAAAVVAGQIALLSPASAERIGADALGSLPPADVYILGEVHDNALHHVHQAQAIEAIDPAALVFEMLTPAQAARAAPDLRDDPERLGAVLDWEVSGWPDFALYFPVFSAAPDAAIRGGALDRTTVRRAFEEPLGAIFGPEAETFGLMRPLDLADQAERESEQMASHCNAMPQAMMAGMVAAQRLRDAALARAVRDALAESGGPVVLIAGTGHARRDVGVPAALAQAAPDLAVVSVGQLEHDPGPGAPYDFWIVTDPAPRADPCAAFR